MAWWYRIHLPMQEDAGDVGLISGSGRSPEEEMATHSSILTWKIPWTEEPGWLQSRGHKKSDTTKQLSTHTTIFCVDFLKILRYLHIFQPPLKKIQVINILVVKLTLELMTMYALKSYLNVKKLF